MTEEGLAESTDKHIAGLGIHEYAIPLELENGMTMKEFSSLPIREQNEYRRCVSNPKIWDDFTDVVQRGDDLIRRISYAANQCFECPLFAACDELQRARINKGRSSTLKGEKDVTRRSKIIREKEVPIGVVAGRMYTSSKTVISELTELTGVPKAEKEYVELTDFGARVGQDLYGLDLTPRDVVEFDEDIAAREAEAESEEKTKAPESLDGPEDTNLLGTEEVPEGEA